MLQALNQCGKSSFHLKWLSTAGDCQHNCVLIRTSTDKPLLLCAGSSYVQCSDATTQVYNRELTAHTRCERNTCSYCNPSPVRHCRYNCVLVQTITVTPMFHCVVLMSKLFFVIKVTSKPYILLRQSSHHQDFPKNCSPVVEMFNAVILPVKLKIDD